MDASLKFGKRRHTSFFFQVGFFLFFILYFLLPWTPCLALPCPALPRPYPTFAPALLRIFLLLPGTKGGSYTGNGQCFFFLLLPGTGGGSYTGNFFSFCCQGQEEEVIQETFFPFAAKDRRRKLHRELFFLLLPGTFFGIWVSGPERTDRH